MNGHVNPPGDLNAQQHAMESCTDVLEVSTHSVLRLQQFESIIPHPLYEQFEMISLQSGCTGDFWFRQLSQTSHNVCLFFICVSSSCC